MPLLKPNFNIVMSDDIQLGVEGDWLRMLNMGDAKVGKTYTVVKTCVQPIFVINCDQPSALRGCRRDGLKFTTTEKPVHSQRDMDMALKMARYLIAEEGYKTVLWDTITVFAEHLLKEMKATRVTRSGAIDNRAAWGDFGDLLINYVDRILLLNANVIVNAHYLNEHEDLVDDEGNADTIAQRKAAKGRLPMIQGRAKKAIAGKFDDIVFMEKTRDGRIFRCSEEGVYGSGGRSVDVKEMPASVKGFMREAGMLPPLEKKSSKKGSVSK